MFAGEYAAQTSGVARPDNRNNWEAALAEAAFMTGLERNADVVTMASYAPLLAHVDAWQWTPNLIWFDNLRSFGTPNYYVQKMYAANRGTRVLPSRHQRLRRRTRRTGSTPARHSIRRTRRGDSEARERHHGCPARARRTSKGAGNRGQRPLTVLASSDPKAENSLEQPTHVAPMEKPLAPRLRVSSWRWIRSRLPCSGPGTGLETGNEDAYRA